MRRASASVSPAPCNSRHRSSACWANSSTISASRAGARFRPESCCRICSLQLSIFDSGHAPDGPYERMPSLALGGQDLPSLRSELVIAPPALAALLDPSALNPATLFQPV